MGQRLIVITYRKDGTRPPVFVSGTFSDPAWQPHEMTSSADASGEHTFEKVVSVEAGAEVQYKFRLGTGDWWTCDDSVAKATDHEGNLNNVLRISSLSIDEGDFEIEEEDSEDAGPPMFSHECFGSHNASPDASMRPGEDGPSPTDSGRRLSSPFETTSESNNEDAIDFNNPRLERFPHENRRSIIAELQRIETSTEPDRSLPEGITPVSPILGSTPVSPSASSPHAALEPEPLARRSNASRASFGSFHSHTSLASIDETVEEGNESLKPKRPTINTNKTPPGAFDTIDYNGVDGSQSSTSQSVHQGEPDTPIVRLEAPSEDEDEGISLSTGSSIKKSDPSHLRKRETRGALEQPASPTSINSIHEVGKPNSWLRSLLRVIFIDLIGGFLSNLLFGKRRKAMLAVGTTVLCAGFFLKTVATVDTQKQVVFPVPAAE